MTDRRATKTYNKFDRDRLKKSEVKQKYVNRFVTHVEESDKTA